MQKRRLTAISIVLFVFLFPVIIQKSFWGLDLSVSGLLVKLTSYSLMGILTIWLLHYYVLKSFLKEYDRPVGGLLLDIGIGLLLLSLYYFLISLGQSTYFHWITSDVDRTTIVSNLTEIFQDNFYSLVLLGPVIWISEGFLAFSRAFLLTNLWKMKPHPILQWVMIVLISMLFAALQLDQQWPGMINAFLLNLVGYICYYKYRRISPLLISGILLQTIDLGTYWVYS